MYDNDGADLNYFRNPVKHGLTSVGKRTVGVDHGFFCFDKGETDLVPFEGLRCLFGRF